jgi:hypothetical protein
MAEVVQSKKNNEFAEGVGQVIRTGKAILDGNVFGTQPQTGRQTSPAPALDAIIPAPIEQMGDFGPVVQPKTGFQRFKDSVGDALSAIASPVASIAEKYPIVGYAAIAIGAGVAAAGITVAAAAGATVATGVAGAAAAIGGIYLAATACKGLIDRATRKAPVTTSPLESF